MFVGRSDSLGKHMFTNVGSGFPQDRLDMIKGYEETALNSIQDQILQTIE